MSEQAKKVIALAEQVTRDLEKVAATLCELSAAIPRTAMEMSIPETLALLEQIPHMQMAQAKIRTAEALLKARLGG